MKKKTMKLQTIVTLYHSVLAAHAEQARCAQYRSRGQGYENDFLRAMQVAQNRDAEFADATVGLTLIVNEAEGPRVSVRRITAEDICRALVEIEDQLRIPKKHMLGIKVHVDPNAQSFCNAYGALAKSKPQSTQFDAEYARDGWRLIRIARDDVRAPSNRIQVELTDDAKDAIVERLQHWG